MNALVLALLGFATPQLHAQRSVGCFVNGQQVSDSQCQSGGGGGGGGGYGGGIGGAVGGAIGGAIGNAILGIFEDHGPSQAELDRRAREAREAEALRLKQLAIKKAKEEARKKKLKADKEELLETMKGVDSGGDLELKGMGEDDELGLKETPLRDKPRAAMGGQRARHGARHRDNGDLKDIRGRGKNPEGSPSGDIEPYNPAYDSPETPGEKTAGSGSKTDDDPSGLGLISSDHAQVTSGPGLHQGAPDTPPPPNPAPRPRAQAPRPSADPDRPSDETGHIDDGPPDPPPDSPPTPDPIGDIAGGINKGMAQWRDAKRLLDLAISLLFPDKDETGEEPAKGKMAELTPMERRSRRVQIESFFKTGVIPPEMDEELEDAGKETALEPAALQKILRRFKLNAKAGRKRALRDLGAVYEGLEAKGLISPSDDLARKQRDDPAVRGPLEKARHRILAQLQADVLDALDAAKDKTRKGAQ